MAVRLRLTRVGSRKNPVWRVVAADGRSKRDGRVLETLGRYNPQRQPSEIVLDRERVEHWLAHGAQPSDTVRKLIRAVERGAPPAGAAAAAERASAGTATTTATAGGGEAAAAETGDTDAGDAVEPAGEAEPAPAGEDAGASDGEG